MIQTAILSFREFFEAFLLIGIFLGISQKLKLQKNKEIIFATITGLFTALCLPIGVFLLGKNLTSNLNETNSDVLEGFLLILSGLFVAYVIFTLHKIMESYRNDFVKNIKEKIKTEKLFDVSLFFSLVFFISREGFEIAVLTGTSSVFTIFSQNITGLFIGFFIAGIFGILISFSLIKICVKKVFKYTEYTIMLFGAAMIKNGASLLLKKYFYFDLSNFLPLHLNFLPKETTITGHILKNTLGIDSSLSIAAIFIMAFYISIIYLLNKG